MESYVEPDAIRTGARKLCVRKRLRLLAQAQKKSETVDLDGVLGCDAFLGEE